MSYPVQRVIITLRSFEVTQLLIANFCKKQLVSRMFLQKWPRRLTEKTRH